jgi:hypothetical protein
MLPFSFDFLIRLFVYQFQVSAASARLGTIASSVTAAVGESNVQAATATVSSLGAKTRVAVSSTVSFLEEKGIVSGAQGLVASAGATAKSVFSFAQSGVIYNSLYFMNHSSQRDVSVVRFLGR